MSILVLQSSWWGRESWLLCLICLPGVSWWLSGSSSRCHGVVCSLWLWYFLIILFYYFWKTDPFAKYNTNVAIYLQVLNKRNITFLWQLINHKYIFSVSELLMCHTIIMVNFNWMNTQIFRLWRMSHSSLDDSLSIDMDNRLFSACRFSLSSSQLIEVPKCQGLWAAKFGCLSACLHVCLFVCPYLCLHFCLSVCVSGYRLEVCLYCLPWFFAHFTCMLV